MFRQIVFFFLLLYGGVGGFLIYNQTSLIYFPGSKNLDFYACSDFLKGARIIEYEGTRMYYKKNGARLAVYYHGSNGVACDRQYYAKLLDEANISYVFVEYSGYAHDPKNLRTSRMDIIRDVKNTVKFVSSLEYSSLTVMGGSIGTGAASLHVFIASRKPDKVILIAPFSRLSDVGYEIFPIYPYRELLLLSNEEYNNVKALRGYTGALLIVHGRDDKLVPFRSGKHLFDLSAASPKIFLPVYGKGHEDLLTDPVIKERIILFLKDNGEKLT